MSRTYIRQSTNIRPSDIFQDNLNLLEAETNSISLETDLNYIRTAIREIKGTNTWKDTIIGNFNLKSIYDKNFVYWIQKTDDITVPTGQNYVVLSSADAPSDVIAYNIGSHGALCAKLNTAVGNHSLAALPNNGNLCEIRLADSNDELYTSANGHNKIYALLQVGNDAVDGENFDDSNNQAQLSFVYFDPLTEELTAVDVSDIAGKKIEYAYRKRTNFYNLPEHVLDPAISFTESTALNEITLQIVYNNSTPAKINLVMNKPFIIDLNQNSNFEIVDQTTNYFKANVSDSAIDIGVLLRVLDGKHVRLYNTNSTYYIDFGVPNLSENNYYVLPSTVGQADYVLVTDGTGALSWKYVGNVLNTKKAWYEVTTVINPNTPISLSNFTNPDNLNLGDGSRFVNDYDVYWNMGLCTNGLNASDDTDVYYVSSTEIAFNHRLKIGDIIQIIQRR